MRRRGGVPSGAAQVIAIAGLALPEITVIVEFAWEILKIFFLTLFFGLRHGMPLPPAAVVLPGAITPEKGNTTESRNERAVWGDRHCPLRKQVLYNLLKTQGFYKAKITYLSDKIVGLYSVILNL